MFAEANEKRKFKSCLKKKLVLLMDFDDPEVCWVF